MSLPQHIAIIQDGNRRWAQTQKFSPWLGHKAGVVSFRTISNAVFDYGIPYLTVWALSIDNLKKRPKTELDFLFRYMEDELSKPELFEDLKGKRVKVKIIGKWRELIPAESLKLALSDLEQKTASFSRHTLTILLAYDGISEMLEAIASLEKESLDYESLKQRLSTGFLPEVDLVIRTGGEPHLSAGFMMWLTRNSQLYFTSTNWPEFGKSDLDLALSDFGVRRRRLGQ